MGGGLDGHMLEPRQRLGQNRLARGHQTPAKLHRVQGMAPGPGGGGAQPSDDTHSRVHEKLPPSSVQGARVLAVLPHGSTSHPFTTVARALGLASSGHRDLGIGEDCAPDPLRMPACSLWSSLLLGQKAGPLRRGGLLQCLPHLLLGHRTLQLQVSFPSPHRDQAASIHLLSGFT